MLTELLYGFTILMLELHIHLQMSTHWTNRDKRNKKLSNTLPTSQAQVTVTLISLLAAGTMA
jgi:ABC-type tungstate transport system substrate-binding protein